MRCWSQGGSRLAAVNKPDESVKGWRSSLGVGETVTGAWCGTRGLQWAQPYLGGINTLVLFGANAECH